MSGAELIQKERCRQITEEDYSSDNDAEHVNGELVSAAISYVQETK